MKEVKQITKIYTLRHFGGAHFETTYCGQKVALDFIAGRGAVGSKRSVLTVTDKFTQDAIEHDARFGNIIVLDAVFGNEEEEKKDAVGMAQKPVVRRRTQAEIDAEKKKAEEKPSADAVVTVVEGASGDTEETVAVKAKKKKKDNGQRTTDNGQRAKDSEQKAADMGLFDEPSVDTDGTVVEEDVTAVEEVKSLNDAYDYFADKGVVVESREELEGAMKEAKVKFPNLEE